MSPDVQAEKRVEKAMTIKVLRIINSEKEGHEIRGLQYELVSLELFSSYCSFVSNKKVQYVLIRVIYSRNLSDATVLCSCLD